MNPYHILWYSLFATVFVLCLIRIIRHGEQDDVVQVPLRVYLSGSMAHHSAQEVYNWVVYVAKLKGRAYLVQLTWDPTSRHDFLLSDLQTAAQSKTQDGMLEHLKLIGIDHWLVTDIVDAPI